MHANDRGFQPLATREEIARAVRAARRTRSEAVHALLQRAVNWVRRVFSAGVRAPRADETRTGV